MTMTTEQIQKFLQDNNFLYLKAWGIEKAIFDQFDHETIKQVITHNMRFIDEHGLYVSDIELFLDIQKQFETRTKGTKKPSPCDMVEVWSNNEHIFFPSAHIEKCGYNNTGWTWVEHASSFFIDLDSYSTSGGVWHELDLKNLEYVGQEIKRIWTWGHAGARGNGGLYVPVLVNKFKMVLNKKWIAMTASVVKDDKYKYKIELWDKKATCYRSGNEYFKTMTEFKMYLKNTGLKIGKKLENNSYYHEIIGDFDYIMHMDLNEYRAEKGSIIGFPIIDNGDCTEAFLKAGKVHFCNPNVKDRPKFPRNY